MPARALSLSPAARAQLGIFLLAYLLYIVGYLVMGKTSLMCVLGLRPMHCTDQA